MYQNFNQKFLLLVSSKSDEAVVGLLQFWFLLQCLYKINFGKTKFRTT